MSLRPQKSDWKKRSHQREYFIDVGCDSTDGDDTVDSQHYMVGIVGDVMWEGLPERYDVGL